MKPDEYKISINSKKLNLENLNDKHKTYLFFYLTFQSNR